MISHSPTIFSHSPPVSFLSEYMNSPADLQYSDENTNILYRPQVIKLQASRPNQNCGRQAALANKPNGHGYGQPQQQQQQHRMLGRMTSAPELPLPPKSCLIRRQKDSSSLEASGLLSEQCRRKKVIFADDQGLSLIHVRVMSEPSNVPPYWSMKFLEQITQGLVSPHPSADTWAVDFKQPASDYLSFRQKIDSNLVSLENVIVKDDESIIVGTVKVKNISFEKEVIVRATWDSWKNQQDIFCTFSKIYNSSGITSTHVIFDTFSFKITLPPSPSKRLEFCICYRADGLEYWDNNNNNNYTISKRSPSYYQALGPYDKNHNKSPLTISNLTSNTYTGRDAADHSSNTSPSPYW